MECTVCGFGMSTIPTDVLTDDRIRIGMRVKVADGPWHYCSTGERDGEAHLFYGKVIGLRENEIIHRPDGSALGTLYQIEWLGRIDGKPVDPNCWLLTREAFAANELTVVD